MRKTRSLFALLPLLLAACQPSQTFDARDAASTISPRNIRAHIEFLADDLLEGRGTGKRGYDIAATYVATQCKLLGLQPAGDEDSYFQQITFRKSRFVDGEAALTINGDVIALDTANDIAIAGSHNAAEESVSAELVFVGWGISAPEFNYDDYADVDVNGKIVVLVRRGAPENFPSDERAYYSSSSIKMQEAIDRGARGVVLMSTPDYQEKVEWDRLKGYFSRGNLEWVAPDGSVPNAYPELKLVGVLSYEQQARLFEPAPLPMDEVMTKLQAGESTTFELPASLDVTRRSEWQEVRSANVACLLPGSDPELRDEYVLFSGHLDHLGVDENSDDEDRIRNGAYDNATGIGVMLELARVYAGLQQAPKRSLLFLAVTAEELGLLGSDYWAANPTVDIDKVSANVNLDMPVLTFAMKDVIAYGAEHSELGDIVREQAAMQGVQLSPDPWPEQVVFVRSDQYSFVKAGVPAVFLVPGWTAVDEGIDGEAHMRGFEEDHYHGVSDDLALPFDPGAAKRFAAVNYLIGLEVANRRKRVDWNAGDFFGKRFGKHR